MGSSYQKHVEYRFEINGRQFAARWFGPDLLIRTIRVVPQMYSGIAVCGKDGWSFGSRGKELESLEDGLSEAIINYLNENPVPKEGESC